MCLQSLSQWRVAHRDGAGNDGVDPLLRAAGAAEKVAHAVAVAVADVHELPARRRVPPLEARRRGGLCGARLQPHVPPVLHQQRAALRLQARHLRVTAERPNLTEQHKSVNLDNLCT